MRWLLASVVTVTVAIVVTSGVARAGGVDRRDSTRRAVDRTNSAILEEGFVPIGGIDQWISIRGENRANPVIVVLHGGPAEAQTPLEVLYAGWEKDFTVVQWDQRGAGKTFGRNGKSTPDMTLDRMVQDGIEVAEYARQRLGKDKVVLLGHSWGAFLGINIIRKRPDLFSAYVGTGQVVSWAQTMQTRYAYAVKRAEAEKDQEAIKQLREIGPPPYAAGPKFFAAQRWIGRYIAESDAKYLQKQLDIVRAAPNFSPQDVQDWIGGGQFSIPLLFATLTAIDLPATLGYDMPVPFFIIQGADDDFTPTKLAEDYFRKIRAPRKKMVQIKNAGHFAYATNQEEFLAALVKYVRPIAISDQ
jgi:proline iminopeptidase